MKSLNYPLYKVNIVNTMKELLETCNKEYSSKTAFEYMDKKEIISRSYKDFYFDVKKLSTSLLHKGYRNTHMALLGEKSYSWILTYFGATNSSNVIIPLDIELTCEEIIGLLKKSDSKVLFFSSKYSKYLDRIKSELAELVLINIDDNHAENEAAFLSELLEEGNVLINAGDEIYHSNEVKPSQLAAIHYTSGTTGVSKGVMLSHKNILSSATGAAQNVDVKKKSVLVLPLNHTFGLTAGVIAPLIIGKTIFINVSMRKIVSDLKEQKPDHLFLVPLFVETMYKQIWNTARRNGKADTLKKLVALSDFFMKLRIDLRQKLFKSVLDGFGGELDVIVCGGAPIDDKYIKGFRSFGIEVLNGYGITECAPIVSVNRNNHYKDGSVGQVLSCCQVKIEEPDKDGNGEILVKGQNVMLGYYKDEKATSEAIVDDWFRTGDIGTMDQDGFLYINGRKKNLIILNNGKNIYPEELEMYVQNIPYVKEVMVYAASDSAMEETAITAEVYLDQDYIESNDIPNPKEKIKQDIDAINKNISYYKNIGQVIVREKEFEKTATKKIKRFYGGGMSNV